MTTPTDRPTAPVPPAAAPSAASAAPPRRNAFFDWIREARIVRTRGWFGGVAAGIAVRTGIDAALIRGILVVITILGFPAILLYAILWALLPDENDTIPLQQLLRGRFQPQMIGIAATFLFAAVPFTSLTARVWQSLTQPAALVSSGGYAFESEPAYTFDYGIAGFSITSALLALTAIAFAVVVSIIIIALARRQRRSQAAAPLASAMDATSVTSGVVSPAAVATPIAADSASATTAVVPEPQLGGESLVADDEVVSEPVPRDGTDEFAQWREQYAQSQKDREAFLVAQQTDAAAETRARQESDADRVSFVSKLVARRAERRISNPRASLGYNLGVVGGAVLVACLVMLTQHENGLAKAIALGAFSGAVALAVGMILAGALRRRSGFLALATVAALVVGGGATLSTKPTSLVWDGAGIWAGTMPEVNQPFGWLQVYANIYEGDHEPLRITKGDGYTTIFVDAGVNLEFDGAIGDAGSLRVSTENATGYMDYQEVIPYDTGNTNSFGVNIRTHRSGVVSATQKITLDQASGWVEIVVRRDWSDAGTPGLVDPDITIKK